MKCNTSLITQCTPLPKIRWMAAKPHIQNTPSLNSGRGGVDSIFFTRCLLKAEHRAEEGLAQSKTPDPSTKNTTVNTNIQVSSPYYEPIPYSLNPHKTERQRKKSIKTERQSFPSDETFSGARGKRSASTENQTFMSTASRTLLRLK
jgi:hypothetical protein